MRADCEVPLCAATITYCNPISGLESQFTYHTMPVVCNASAPFDVCDEPEYCIPTTLACDQEPNRYARVVVARLQTPGAHACALSLCKPGAARLRRSTMVFQPPCSHLLSAASIYPASHFMRCWEQADGSASHSNAITSGVFTGERMQLQYQADDSLLTAMVPAVTATAITAVASTTGQAPCLTAALTPTLTWTTTLRVCVVVGGCTGHRPDW